MMLLSTDGLPGPVMTNKFGKPAMVRPRYVRGPAAHLSRNERPPRPRMSTASKAPVMASKPIANTRASRAYSAACVRTPGGVMASIGSFRMSTSVTLSRLNVA